MQNDMSRLFRDRSLAFDNAGHSMESIVRQGILYDFYGDLLSERQRRVYEEHVYHDLTLSEIASEYAISRQAAHDLVRRIDRKLENYEERLGLVARFRRIQEKAWALKEMCLQIEERGSASEKDSTSEKDSAKELTSAVNKLIDEILEEM